MYDMNELLPVVARLTKRYTGSFKIIKIPKTHCLKLLLHKVQKFLVRNLIEHLVFIQKNGTFGAGTDSEGDGIESVHWYSVYAIKERISSLLFLWFLWYNKYKEKNKNIDYVISITFVAMRSRNRTSCDAKRLLCRKRTAQNGIGSKDFIYKSGHFVFKGQYSAHHYPCCVPPSMPHCPEPPELNLISHIHFYHKKHRDVCGSGQTLMSGQRLDLTRSRNTTAFWIRGRISAPRPRSCKAG